MLHLIVGIWLVLKSFLGVLRWVFVRYKPFWEPWKTAESDDQVSSAFLPYSNDMYRASTYYPLGKMKYPGVMLSSSLVYNFFFPISMLLP